MLLCFLPLTLLATTGYSSPPYSKAYTCHPFTTLIPVSNVTTIVPFFPPFANGLEATLFSNLITQRSAPTPHVNLTTLTKDFTIEGAVCTPNHPNANTSILHIASHGLGFDRSYWDFYLPSTPNDAQYSYVAAATGAGYTVLTYNRLGISPSSLANPYSEIQTSVELSILATLTTLARRGAIPGLQALPTKVVHIGHSYGSQLTFALAALFPQLTDGIVLTGYSAETEYANFFLASTNFHLVNTNQPRRFPRSKYSNGFLTWGDRFANQYSFLRYPEFDPKVLDYAEAHKQPFAIAELTSGALVPNKAPNFKKPVLWLGAEHDLIFCGGNCTGLYARGGPTVQSISQGGRDVETHVVPGVGHGINLHFGAREKAYAVVLRWVGRKF